MADYHTHTQQQHIVCSMCGDIGFPEKLFRCNTCSNRFQHSYCSNYYREAAAEPIETCDWCKSEEINKSKQEAATTAASSSSLRKHTTYSSSSAEKASAAAGNRSEYSSGAKIIKQHVKDDFSSEKEKGTSKSISTTTGGGGGGGGGSPSPRTSGTRRYKLLKDVISAKK